MRRKDNEDKGRGRRGRKEREWGKRDEEKVREKQLDKRSGKWEAGREEETR